MANIAILRGYDVWQSDALIGLAAFKKRSSFDPFS